MDFFSKKEYEDIKNKGMSNPKKEAQIRRLKIFGTLLGVSVILLIALICTISSNKKLQKQLDKQEQQLNEATDKIAEIIKFVPQVDYTNEEPIEDMGYMVHTKEDDPTQYAVRLTSYYTGDGMGSSKYTGSGINTDKFKVNDKGWYTYDGKLVLAAATKECLNSTKGACGKYKWSDAVTHYYSYFDELNITIDNVEYTGIVLDSCGASMSEDRIDLFVKDKSSVIDRGYLGNNPAIVQIPKK